MTFVSKPHQKDTELENTIDKLQRELARVKDEQKARRSHYGAIPKWIFQATYKTEIEKDGKIYVVEARISRDAVFVYGWMQARYGGLAKGIFPKLSTLAGEMGVCEKSVRNWMTELYYAGAVSIDRPHPPTQRSSTYILEDEQQERSVRPLKEAMKNR